MAGRDRTTVRDVKEFQPLEMFEQGFTAIFYGLRRCGKNVALRDMMARMYPRIRDHEVYVLTGTGIFNYEKQWEHIPRSAVKTETDRMEEILQELLSERLTWWENHFAEGGGERPTKRARKDAGASASDGGNQLNPKISGRFGSNTDEGKAIELDGNNLDDSSDDDDDSGNDEDECPFPPMLLIMDDCVHEQSIRHCPTLNKVFIAGRHMQVDVVVFSQNFCGSGSVPPPIREQAEVLVVMALPRSTKARKMIEEEYLTISDNIPKGAGLRLMADVTSVPHRGFVITKNINTARYLKDYCFYYGPAAWDKKRDNHPKQILRLKYGTPEQWAKDEEIREKNAVKCNPDLMAWNPAEHKRKRQRNGKMQKNESRTLGLRSRYDAHVSAPSERRISLTGNMFGGGAGGTLNPRH